MTTQHYHKTSGGFSLIEVIISAFLIIILLIGVFRVNVFLSQNNKDIIRTTLINRYGQYLSAAVRLISPGSLQGTFFVTLVGNTITYSTNPLDKKTSAGFFSPEDSYVSEQVDYVGSGSVSWVSFDTYRITVDDSINGTSKVYFVTR